MNAAAAAGRQDGMKIYLVETNRGIFNPIAITQTETLLADQLDKKQAAKEADWYRKYYNCDGITSDIIIREEEEQ